MMKSRNLVLVTMFAFLCSASSVAADDKVLAKYGNGQLLYKSEVDRLFKASSVNNLPDGKKNFDDLNSNAQKQLVNGIVQQKIIKQAMEQSSITQSAAYKQNLEAAQEGTAIRFFLHQVAQQRLNNEKLNKAYSQLVKELKSSDELKVSHILVKDKAVADNLALDIKDGRVSFEQAAKDNSVDTASRATGGTLGYISKGQLVPEFEKAAYGLKQGTISAPVQTEFGWHLIKVDDVRKRKIPAFEEIKPQLEQSVLMNTTQEYVGDLIKKANIEVLVDKQ